MSAKFPLPSSALGFDEERPQISTSGFLGLDFQDFTRELKAQKPQLGKPTPFASFSGLEARMEKLKVRLFFKRPIDPKTGKSCEVKFPQRRGAFRYEEVFYKCFQSIAECKISLIKEAKGDEVLIYVLENIKDLKGALDNLKVSQERTDKKFTGFFGALAASCRTLEQLHVNDLSQSVMEREKLQIEGICKAVERALRGSDNGLLAGKALSKSDHDLSVEKTLSKSNVEPLVRRTLSGSDVGLLVKKPLSESDNGLLENFDVIRSRRESSGPLVRAKRYLSHENVGVVECPYLFQDKTFNYIKDQSNFSEAKELVKFYNNYLALLQVHHAYFTQMISSHLLLKNEAQRIIGVIDRELSPLLEGNGGFLEGDAGESSGGDRQKERAAAGPF